MCPAPSSTDAPLRSLADRPPSGAPRIADPVPPTDDGDDGNSRTDKAIGLAAIVVALAPLLAAAGAFWVHATLVVARWAWGAF